MKTQTEIPQAVVDWLESAKKEAYQKGWADATAALVQAAASARPTDSSPKGGGLKRKPFKPANAEGEESNRDKVIRALRAKPGMRFADIPRWLQEEDPSVNRLTILTTAKRLYKTKVLKKRGVRLYVNDTPEQEAA